MAAAQTRYFRSVQSAMSIRPQAPSYYGWKLYNHDHVGWLVDARIVNTQCCLCGCIYTRAILYLSFPQCKLFYSLIFTFIVRTNSRTAPMELGYNSIRLGPKWLRLSAKRMGILWNGQCISHKQRSESMIFSRR